MIESANFRLRLLSAFALSLFALNAPKQSFCSNQPDAPADNLSQLIGRLASNPDDTCLAPPTKDLYPDQIEQSILDQAADLVVQQLNQAGPELTAARDQATKALNQIAAISESANASWPKESRFHFEFLTIPPALVLKVGIATHEDYFIFGIPAIDPSGKPDRQWQKLGEDQLDLEREVSRTWMTLYPVQRGPSRNPRFLAAIGYSGCAGSSGILYDLEEWNPGDIAGTQQIVKQKGAFGMDEHAEGGRPSPKDPFAPIGKLETEGSTITLPYCWFSAVDTWDNPSMCAVDTYDLSGDMVKFRSRAYNRPDLLPIVKVIEYGQNHDFSAVRGYCASDDVARRIVEVVPPYYFAGAIRVIKMTPERERVVTGGESADLGDEFDVEKRNGRWLVVKFAPGKN